MNLFPAQPFDIDAIMKIERQAFVPSVQEKKGVFEKRIKIFPQGFLILSDSSEEVVKKNGNALVCGYLCSEIWNEFPDVSLDEKAFSRAFALGHNIKHTHTQTGSCLYVSSFAILRDYQNKGLGAKFFRAALASLTGAFPSIKTIALLVSSEWTNAQKIYDSLGFEKVRTLQGFFPTIEKKIRADALVLRASSDIFQKIEFKNESQNEFAGIRI